MTYQNLQDSEDNSIESVLGGSGSGPASSDNQISLDPTSSNSITSNSIALKGSAKKRSLSDWVSGPRGLLLGLALGLGLALLATRLSAQRTAAPADTPADIAQVSSATVTTARAQTASVQQTIETNGTVEAFDLLAIAPQANGLQIRSVNVREGDRVVAGEVLAVLDDSVLRSQIEQAEAQVNAALADVAQEKAQAEQARASLTADRENLSRYESLFARGAISAEELTSRRTQVATAEQTVGSARAAIESAEATVRSRQADVARLMTQLDQTLVIAPSNGIVAEKTATVGAAASTGTPLFEIIDGEQLELAVKIPQTQMAKVSPGTTVQITSDSDANLQLQGTVRSIDPVVDPQTRQATVKIGLPGSDRLRPGMFLQAAIVTGSRQGVTVPAEAVLPQSSGGFVVYTLNSDGTVKANAVEVGDRIPAEGDTPATIEIISGLQANTPVVVEGASYVQDGDAVTVVSGGNG
ncbi:MAG: efflux RND transporter periplasmic adaptor subunit [Cyanobacteria bacterium J06554_11]